MSLEYTWIHFGIHPEYSEYRIHYIHLEYTSKIHTPKNEEGEYTEYMCIHVYSRCILLYSQEYTNQVYSYKNTLEYTKEYTTFFEYEYQIVGNIQTHFG